MMKKLNINLLLVFSCIVALSSCGPETQTLSKNTNEYDYKVASDWSNQFLQVERYTLNAAPPASARQMGFLNLACYEAVIPGMENEYRSVAANFQGLTIPGVDKNKQYDWAEVYNACYSRSLVQYFKDMPASISFDVVTLENKWEKDLAKTVTNDVIDRSRDYGRRVADAVYQWSLTDKIGADLMNNLKPQYNAPKGPGFWFDAGTGQSSGQAITPQLGDARGFTLKQGENIARSPSEAYGIEYSEDSNSLMYLQAKEVQVTANKAKSAGSYNDLYWRAEFWSDDIKTVTFTPPGRIVAIAMQVFSQDNVTLSKAVTTLAQIGLASTDAGIATWKAKFTYNVERPNTYISRVIGDKSWTTLLGLKPTLLGKGITPPFPAYPSGHSTFGGAGAVILSDAFGYNHPVTDRCHEGRTEFYGKARNYKNFVEQGEENAYSRIPLGVHYRMDCDEGLYVGREVAKRVLALTWKR
jgi:hypothetical protein